MTTSPTTETRKLPELSEKTVQTLKNLRDTDKTQFHAYVFALRQEKWPLRAISEALDVSRSIVSIWEKKGADEPQAVAEVEKMPKDLPTTVRPVYSSYSLSDDDKDTLRLLAIEGAKVRRFTDPNSLSRKAATELEDLLHMHREKGASLADLASACGVSRRAIAQRLEKRKWQS